MKKMMLASQAKEKEQFSPHYDSNSAPNEYIDDESENSETGYMAAEKEDDHVMSNRPMLESRAEITQQKKQVLVQQMNKLDHQKTTVTQKTPQVGQDVILYSYLPPL